MHLARGRVVMESGTRGHAERRLFERIDAVQELVAVFLVLKALPTGHPVNDKRRPVGADADMRIFLVRFKVIAHRVAPVDSGVIRVLGGGDFGALAGILGRAFRYRVVPARVEHRAMRGGKWRDREKKGKEFSREAAKSQRGEEIAESFPLMQ